MRKSARLEEELFAAALALPATERNGYLERACAGDRELYARIRTLLDAAPEAADFVRESPAVASLRNIGEQLGDYTLLREIGEGGCGTVYLAEQRAPVKRTVALKILKLGMDTKAVIARFEAERQALALMDHPNIAKVFDGAATPAGRPYFVMELVQGPKITEYCDQGRLSISERLVLLQQVCHAIHHAHQRGIIHRDIKPSNVLVTLHDGVPFVKVIDFGVAKAVQGRLTDQTVYTAIDQFVGTPAYLSPEQIDLSGGNVDARSDIYSLGVLLYELLTGRTPFALPELLKLSIDEIRRQIREQDPLSPSKCLRSLSEEQLAELSTHYRTTPTKLIDEVEGDLDRIVMHCLEKQPARRYQAANDLALDLQRYLSNEPVTARVPSVAYTLRKFARRHRAMVTTIATIAAVLIIGTVVSTWMAVRAIQAEHASQQLISFFENELLAQASPVNEPDRDVKLRTVLDRASERIDGRFAGQPLLEASIRTTLGETYNELAEFETARRHLERALALYRQQSRPETRRTLKAMAILVGVTQGEGKYAEAEKLAVETLELQRRVLGPDDVDTLRSMDSLSIIYQNQGKYTQAEDLQSQALEIQTQVFGPEHEGTLRAMFGLGMAYAYQGELSRAEPLLRRSLALHQRVFGQEHSRTLTVMNNLAGVYMDQGNFHAAEILQLQTLEIQKRVLGPEHPRTAIGMNNLAGTYDDDGKFAEAETLYAQALTIFRRVLGAEHPHTLSCASNLAKVQREQGQLAQAEALHSAVLSTARRVQGSDHPETLPFIVNLAITLDRAGKVEQSQTLFTEGLGISQRLLGSEHPQTVRFSYELAAVLQAQRKFVEAERMWRLALNGYQGLSHKDWRLFSVQSRLGETLLALHRIAEAEPLVLSGYDGLKEQTDRIPAAYKSEVREAGARILRLYAAWEKPESLQEWQRKLGERQSPFRRRSSGL